MAVDPRWRPLAPSAATHSRSARAAVRRVQAFLMAWPSTSGQPFPARPARARCAPERPDCAWGQQTAHRLFAGEGFEPVSLFGTFVLPAGTPLSHALLVNGGHAMRLRLHSVRGRLPDCRQLQYGSCLRSLSYSVLVCLRNQPLETQCWILAQFLS